ncbi:hypothetical protein D9M69_614950 [compost metagenome]
MNIADIGVKHGAVRAYQATVRINLLLRTRWCSQLRMVPHRDVQHIIGANPVSPRLERQQLGWHRGLHFCRRVLGNQFGRYRNQLDPTAVR